MAGRAAWTRVLDNADEQTARLIIKLQLEDLEVVATQAPKFTTSSKGRDANLAFWVYGNELKQEKARRGFVDDQTAATDAQSTAATAVAAHAGEPVPQPLVNEPGIVLFKCCACGDSREADDCYQMPCQHYYCDGCLTDLFRASTTDQSLYPPRCCRQVMPYDDIRMFLSQDLQTAFEAARVLYEDPDPAYCRIPTCSAHIDPTHRQENTGTCPVCKTSRCLACKNPPHQGACSPDEETQAFNNLAQREGWQRCPSCSRTISLEQGCNHMSCPCGAQFCYVCGVQPWKTCGCPQWDPARLIARTAVIENREPGQGGHAARVAAAAQRLRDHHNCDHSHWTKVNGPHRCEECTQTLPLFIFQCRQCHLQACWRCRNNRL